ncbi:MAG: hypothetical protein IIA14_05865 [SAR324 cluster bacterium]|nr:hypothetical protein [SAR324 cluster bacterium]
MSKIGFFLGFFARGLVRETSPNPLRGPEEQDQPRADFGNQLPSAGIYILQKVEVNRLQTHEEYYHRHYYAKKTGDPTAFAARDTGGNHLSENEHGSQTHS